MRQIRHLWVVPDPEPPQPEWDEDWYQYILWKYNIEPVEEDE